MRRMTVREGRNSRPAQAGNGLKSPTVEALAEQYEGKVLVAKVNVDEEPELARAFGVMSIPTVVFLKNGREFDRKVGLMPAGAFTAVLDSNL